MTVDVNKPVVDAAQRAAAIDISRSCIVQAPAGSGKTELLIQRLLGLLGVVERPQQILAITFTNKAAAEMRQRLIDALRHAQTAPQPPEPHHALTWSLARKALGQHGESLLKNPAQLSIQTIDSFNAALVRKMPWLSRFGSLPQMADEADSLYRKAVDQLCLLLEQGGEGSKQLEILLRHLDNQLVVLQDLLVDMLRKRDQWLRYLHSDYRTTQEELQQALESLYNEKLKRLEQVLPSALAEEILQCLRFAAGNLPDSEVSSYGHWTALPPASYNHLGEWVVLGNWLLTGKGELRKRLTKKEGFPSGKEFKPGKDRMTALLKELASYEVFVCQLDQIRNLPVQGYSDQQWQLLEALIDVLPLLLYQLWMVFRYEGEADFAEIALKANNALGNASNPSDLLLKIDHDLRHILIDEFQDTSRLQYQLLETLTSGWSAGDGRTLFLVGDPMQSIYLFREAEVGLFLHSFKGRFGQLQHPLTPLRLSCNFRSQQGIVDWVNDSFAKLFPDQTDEVSGAVPLSEAASVKPVLHGTACEIHPFSSRDDRAEALKVLDLICNAQKVDPEQSIAILVRGRNHLNHILPLLHERQINYRARDIELLGDRSAALDLVHLTKAVLHRGDRLSWLAVLRAPWCGLTLKDLHALAGKGPNRTIVTLISDSAVVDTLSDDGQRRIKRIWPILNNALSGIGRFPVREIIESCWLTFGGPACCDSTVLADVELVLTLLERLDSGGNIADLDQIDRGLAQLFSNPEASDCKLEIMTIHKAKGLEFDTVIIPGLGRPVGRIDQPLVRWFEHPEHGLLIAPLPAKASKNKDPLYQVISEFERQKQDYETSRLLYVAATRAIRKLHLLGHAKSNSRGELVPASGSLLEKLWPVVKDRYLYEEPSDNEAQPVLSPPQLKRLPTDWLLPKVTTVQMTKGLGKGVASGQHEERDFVYSGWEDPFYRHVGTIVHQQLEMIARFGHSYWGEQVESHKLTGIRSSLRRMGIAEAAVEDGIMRVKHAVDRVLASDRGRWLLDNHERHASEMPLTGVVDGRVIHAIIDRTFIADGVRWIVDYKSSSPGKKESRASFLEREVERYQSQMQVYIDLFKALDEGVEIRAALYFPMIDSWCELPE